MSVENPFGITNKKDDNLRPFTRGMFEHDSSVASILLYTGDVAINSSPVNPPNYLDKNSREKADTISPTTNTATRGRSMQLSPNQIPVLDTGNRGLYYGIFNNFSLLEVSEAKDQIVKLHQNFGRSWNLFFFGDSPSIYNFRGVFLDTMEYPYYQEFMTMYDKYLAGRKCVEAGYKMKISYDGKIVGGYLMNIKTVSTGDSPFSKTFSFTVIITDENFLRNNLAVQSKEFNGVSAYNQLNNGHRVIDQYGSLFNNQVTDISDQSTSVASGESHASKGLGRSQQILKGDS